MPVSMFVSVLLMLLSIESRATPLNIARGCLSNSTAQRRRRHVDDNLAIPKQLSGAHPPPRPKIVKAQKTAERQRREHDK